MREKDAIEFYNLGLGEYYTFASISGSGTGDLLDALIDAFGKTRTSSRRSCFAFRCSWTS
jgi:predicted GTPase